MAILPSFNTTLPQIDFEDKYFFADTKDTARMHSEKHQYRYGPKTSQAHPIASPLQYMDSNETLMKELNYGHKTRPYRKWRHPIWKRRDDFR